MSRLLVIVCMVLCLWQSAAASDGKTDVYVFPLRENISLSSVRMTKKCLGDAEKHGADIVVVDLSTYGGLLDAADSIRGIIQEFPMPVYVWVRDRAVSAGALIALSADKIYMSGNGTIGAATVVNQRGEPMPDKYQSFMRALMRSTAESHGKRISVADGDTSFVWIRNPQLAENMVGGAHGDSASVLSFTASEAADAGFSEGTVCSLEDIMLAEGISDYRIYEYRLSALDRIMGFLSNPLFQSLMIMLIVGGIYFELQTPGVGLPLCVALLGAALYFAPLYIEGVLENWELITFLVGVLLVVLELFVTPGFGMFGIVGVTAMIFGLTFAIIDRDLLRYIPSGEISASYLTVPLCTVAGSIIVSLVLSMWIGKRLLGGNSRLKKSIVLESNMTSEQGYVSHADGREIVGQEGVASTDLKPSGRVYVGGRAWQAAADEGLYILKDEKVRITRYEGGVAYCKKISEQ